MTICLKEFAHEFGLVSVVNYPYGILPTATLQCCHQAIPNKLVTKTDQFCTTPTQRQIVNRAVLANAIVFVIT